MPPSTTLDVGMDVHREPIAVACVAQDHGADVVFLGSIGTRQCDIDQLIRKMPSKATHLVLADEAGPSGDWLCRYLTKKDDICWVVAPSLTPQKGGRPRQYRPSRRHPIGPPDALGRSHPYLYTLYRG
jgi:transposase